MSTLKKAAVAFVAAILAYFAQKLGIPVDQETLNVIAGVLVAGALTLAVKAGLAKLKEADNDIV